MLEKKLQLVISFATTTMAMKMEDVCRQEGLQGRLIPLPTAISAGCGLAWKADLETEDLLVEKMTERAITWEGIHKILLH